MLAIKNILCATDFSESSDFAFRVACALARDYGARLVVLHVVTPPTMLYAEVGAFIPPPDEFNEPLREKLLQLQLRDKRVVVEHRLVEGEAAAAILAVAEGVKADVIVLGTHGRTGLARLVMGSVAEQVLRRAPCPVLTVKKPLPGSSPPVEAPTTATDEVAAGVR
jgi:nucleotide-binding universal stress UspA family protein